MRVIRFVSLSIVVASIAACSKEDPREKARQQAAALEAKEQQAAKPAAKVRPPVPGEARVPCEQLVADPAAYQTALGEADPVTVKDVTKSDADAASSCSIVKGGKMLTQKEQEALAKKTNHRLGVLAGDDLCNVTAYCWTIETKEGFLGRCKDRGWQETSEMGTPSCVQVVQQGADDVHVHHFFDEDTKCVLKVRGGPSNTDNDKILACAKVARDTIGPAQIAVEGPAPGAP